MNALNRRLPAPISWRGAVRRQFRWIGQGRRRQLLVLLGVGVIIAVAASLPVRIPGLLGKTGEDGVRTMVAGWWTIDELSIFAYPDLWTLVLTYQVLLLLGLLWPASIWRDEPPDQRDFFRTLPVVSPGHELARLAAGALWLTIAIAAILSLATVGILVAGHGSKLGVLSPRGWIHYLTGPVTFYLLASVAALAARRPLRAVLLTIALLFGSFSLAATLEIKSLYAVCDAIVGGPLSYGAGMSGPVEDLMLVEPSNRAPPGATNAIAVVLWLALGLAGVIAAARWRPKT